MVEKTVGIKSQEEAKASYLDVLYDEWIFKLKMEKVSKVKLIKNRCSKMILSMTG